MTAACVESYGHGVVKWGTICSMPLSLFSRDFHVSVESSNQMNFSFDVSILLDMIVETDFRNKSIFSKVTCFERAATV